MKTGARAIRGRSLLASSRGTMALTMSQMFVGAVTIGIAGFRGTEAYEGFHFETQLGHANYAASKLGGDHARSANSIANNNVISASILGPRFAVEADNMTMLVNAAIACPQTNNAYMQKICQEFRQNYPRMLTKLAWVRLKQTFLWGSLGNLSQMIDKVASTNALSQIQSTVGGVDGNVSIRVSDPSLSGSIWGSDNTSTSCMNSQKDALASPMPESAFPTLMENLLQGLPESLTQAMPQILCGLSSAAQGGGGGGGGQSQNPVQLPQIPSVAQATQEDCGALAQQFESQILRQLGAGGPPRGVAQTAPVLSSNLAAYVTCAPSASPTNGWSSYTYLSHGTLVTCTFDMNRCQKDMLDKNSASFLASVGLPSGGNSGGGGGGGGGLGGMTHAPTDSNWNHASSMRACAYSTKPINPAVASVNDALNKVMSFGMASSSETLRATYEYQSCAKWYFPDKEGKFAGTPHEQQPFVAAWKYAMVLTGNGG